MAQRNFTLKVAALALAVPVLGAVTWAVIADDNRADKPAAAASTDQRALDVLQQHAKHIASLDAYSVAIVQSMRMEGPFGSESSEEKFQLAVAKPNRLAITHAARSGGEAIISDGDNFFVYFPMFGTYVQESAPGNLTALFKQIQSDTMMTGSLPMGLLTPMLAPDGPGGELGTIRSATYVGTEQLDGAEAHRLSLVIVPTLTESGMERLRDEMGPKATMAYHIDAWIGAGDEPRLHKLHFNVAKMLAEMMPDMFDAMPGMSEMKYEMTLALSDWKTGEDVSSDRFVFSAPESAEKVESMEALMAKLEEMMGQPSASPTELLGKETPDFEMQSIDGATVTPAQHKGRDIVILDFWATWCVPCIQALPDLMAVADAYKDRNVVFYAVNVQEGQGAIEAFLAQRNWDLKVPMDSDGSVSRNFNVMGIPQTVIIDKEGTIQAVHVGAVPKSVLERELETLLRGEKLVEASEEEDAG